MDEKTKNYEYLDVLRFLACFAVILLHYSGSYKYRYGIPTFDAGTILFTATRWCVPVFLMISGALLLGRSYDPGQFYKKRLLRILPPFLFWSVVYIAFKLYHSEIETQQIPQLLMGGAEFHFWYVYMILGIILFLPFLTPWTEKRNMRSILLFLAIWLYWLISANQYQAIYVSLDLSYFSGFIGYLLLGYCLHITPSQKSHLLIGIILFCIGFIYSYYATVQISNEQQQFIESEQRYLSWNIACMSAGIFLVVKQLALPERFMKVVTKIARYSFSIYLAHIIVRDTLVKDYFTFLDLEAYSFLIIKSAIVMGFSYVIAKILSKIPVAGKFISG